MRDMDKHVAPCDIDEVVERLRAVSHDEILRSANPEHEIVNELLKAFGVERNLTYTGTFDAMSNRVIELIEHGGRQDVSDCHRMLPNGMTGFDFTARMLALAERTGIEYDEGRAVYFLGDVIDELDKRLMPPDMEWMRFGDGKRVEFGSVVDSLDGPCEKFIFTRSQGGVCQLQDADGHMVNVFHGERVKRPEPEVRGADGELIRKGDTVYLAEHDYEPYLVEMLPERDGGMVLVFGLESKREKLYAYYPNQLTHTHSVKTMGGE